MGEQVSESIALLVFILREESGQGQDEGNLGQLRRLEGDEAGLQPALGARACAAEKRDHDQQEEAKKVKRIGVANEGAVIKQKD